MKISAMKKEAVIDFFIHLMQSAGQSWPDQAIIPYIITLNSSAMWEHTDECAGHQLLAGGMKRTHMKKCAQVISLGW